MGSQAVRRAALLAGCSQAQALLAWAIARGVSVVPKSGHAGRQAQNLAVGRGFRLPTEAAAAPNERGPRPPGPAGPARHAGSSLQEQTSE